MKKGNILWYQHQRLEIVMYQVTIIRLQELIYLLDSKAMKPKGNVIIVPNVLFQNIFDKGPQNSLGIQFTK